MIKIALSMNIVLSVFGFLVFGLIVVKNFLSPLPDGSERPYTILYIYWTIFSLLFFALNYPIAKRIAQRRILYFFFYYIVSGLIVVFPYLVQYF